MEILKIYDTPYCHNMWIRIQPAACFLVHTKILSLRTHKFCNQSNKSISSHLLCRIQKFFSVNYPVNQSTLQDHELPQLSSLKNVPVRALCPGKYLSCWVNISIVMSLSSIYLFKSAFVIIISSYFLYKLCNFN